MKKKVVITVLCVMSCFMLASCGKKGNEGKDPLTGEEQNQAEESSSTEESQTGDNRDFDTVLSEASQPMEIMDYLNTNLPNASNEDTNRYLGGLLSFGNDVRDIDFTQAEQETSYREELEQLAKEKGAEYLHEKLREVDPKSAENIHANNVKRVIRALEFYHQNGTPISEHNEEQKQQTSPYNLAYFVLTAPREILYERIDRRVDQMMEEGLLEEVKSLRERGCHRGMVSMQGLGYKEILAYLEGEMSLDEAVYVLKRDTRHFAKRQLTWFRANDKIHWFDVSGYESFTDLYQEMVRYSLGNSAHP